METIVNFLNANNCDLTEDTAYDLLINNHQLYHTLNTLVNNSKMKNEVINNYIINNNFSILLTVYFKIINKDLRLWLDEESKNYRKDVLSKEETIYLINKYQKEHDLDARNKLYEHNIGLIRKIAYEYKKKTFLEFDDLFQEGSIGFLKALENFDINKGVALSTYASCCIKSFINRFIICNSSSIKQSFSANETYNKIKKYEELLTKKLGRNPKIEELSEELQISVKGLSTIIYNKYKTVSLEECLYEDSDRNYLETIPDKTINIEEEALTNIELEELLQIVQEKLSSRDAEIFILKRGLNNNRQHSLSELAKKYNLTYETIRRIDKKIERIIKNIYLKRINESDFEPGLRSEKRSYPITKIFNDSFENIKYAISELSEEEIDIVKQIFGKKIDKKPEISNIEYEKYINLIILINMLLQYDKTDKFIYDCLVSCDKKELKIIIKKLGLNIFYELFGENLDIFNIVSEKQRIILARSYIQINPYLNLISLRTRSLYNFFPNFSHEDIRNIINNQNELTKILLYKRFGYSLEGLYPLSKKEIDYFYMNIRSNIQNQLEDNCKIARNNS